MKLQMRKNNFM